MIQFTRAFARQVRAVFRRGRLHRDGGTLARRVLFCVGDGQLRVRGQSYQLAIEIQHPHVGEPAELLLPFECLDRCAGASSDVVTLERRSEKTAVLRWPDHGVPQEAEFPIDRPPTLPELPPLPTDGLENPPAIWDALRDAVATTEPNSARYALECLQLKGKARQIVATDGRQILVQSGFQFPWDENLLVPASPVLGCRELASDESLSIGKAAEWIMLQKGDWQLWLAIDRDRRFPNVEAAVPDADAARSRLILDPADAEFLTTALPRLPEPESGEHGVTLDLNGLISIWARGEGQPRATELLLSRSRLEGRAITCDMNRQFLKRAVSLGFRKVLLSGPEVPAVCVDDTRKYVWAMLAPPAEPLSAEPDPIRIDSMSTPAGSPNSRPVSSWRSRRMAESPPNGAAAPAAEAVSSRKRKAHNRNGHNGRPVSDNAKTAPALEQVVALRSSLKTVLGQTNELIRTLKRQRRESRLVETTLASLKQLQGVAP